MKFKKNQYYNNIVTIKTMKNIIYSNRINKYTKCLNN